MSCVIRKGNPNGEDIKPLQQGFDGKRIYP
ncbi:hypothetical protein SAMN05518861_109253 [Mesorhizobium sp. YR577]|jgi:hypothetical protein|nr:hypothetical protein SAMN05518861_109253 [Mesorhizobium sp. YR577]